MTQDDVSDKLGLTGECKRRTMTRYEKGFTGSNKNKSYSTDIGLYLAKKSDCLGLRIDIESKEKFYTKVSFVFPKMKLYDTK